MMVDDTKCVRIWVDFTVGTRAEYVEMTTICIKWEEFLLGLLLGAVLAPANYLPYWSLDLSLGTDRDWC